MHAQQINNDSLSYGTAFIFHITSLKEKRNNGHCRVAKITSRPGLLPYPPLNPLTPLPPPVPPPPSPSRQLAHLQQMAELLNN